MNSALLNNRVVFWLAPVLYIVFASRLIEGMELAGDIAPALAFKAGFAALLMTGLVISNKVKTVGLSMSVNWQVLPLYWPFALLIAFTISQPTVSHTLAQLTQLLVFCLLIGFIEEVIFRGLMFHWLRKHSKVKIVLYSSVVFGLVHGVNIFSGDDLRVVLMQVFVAFSVGLVFAITRMKDSSLMSVIVVHALIDFSEYAANGLNASTVFTNQSLMLWLVPGVVFFSWGMVLLFQMRQNDNK